jgi:hypothetical protein
VDSSKNGSAQTIDAQTIDPRTVVLTMPELQSSHVLMPARPAVADLARSGHAHLRHPMTDGARWRGKGEVCPQPALTAAATEGGRIAGFGAYDVTDTKFSSQMGPPSCSPPV